MLQGANEDLTELTNSLSTSCWRAIVQSSPSHRLVMVGNCAHCRLVRRRATPLAAQHGARRVTTERGARVRSHVDPQPGLHGAARPQPISRHGARLRRAATRNVPPFVVHVASAHLPGLVPAHFFLFVLSGRPPETKVVTIFKARVLLF